jgi:hypothetical protein
MFLFLLLADHAPLVQPGSVLQAYLPRVALQVAKFLGSPELKTLSEDQPEKSLPREHLAEKISNVPSR